MIFRHIDKFTPDMVGRKIKITRDTSCHHYPKGAILTITMVDQYDRDSFRFRLKESNQHGSHTWIYANECQLGFLDSLADYKKSYKQTDKYQKELISRITFMEESELNEFNLEKYKKWLLHQELSKKKPNASKIIGLKNLPEELPVLEAVL